MGKLLDSDIDLKILNVKYDYNSIKVIFKESEYKKYIRQQKIKILNGKEN